MRVEDMRDTEGGGGGRREGEGGNGGRREEEGGEKWQDGGEKMVG